MPKRTPSYIIRPNSLLKFQHLHTPIIVLTRPFFCPSKLLQNFLQIPVEIPVRIIADCSQNFRCHTFKITGRADNHRNVQLLLFKSLQQFKARLPVTLRTDAQNCHGNLWFWRIQRLHPNYRGLFPYSHLHPLKIFAHLYFIFQSLYTRVYSKASIVIYQFPSHLIYTPYFYTARCTCKVFCFLRQYHTQYGSSYRSQVSRYLSTVTYSPFTS